MKKECIHILWTPTHIVFVCVCFHSEWWWCGCKWQKSWFMWIIYSWVIAKFSLPTLRSTFQSSLFYKNINAINQKQSVKKSLNRLVDMREFETRISNIYIIFSQCKRSTKQHIFALDCCWCCCGCCLLLSFSFHFSF